MKKDITSELISKLKKKDVNSIKSVSPGFTPPRSLAYKGSRKKFTPDIVARYENHSDFFAVEAKYKKKDLPELISKWILFGLTARIKGGRFYLVVNKDQSSEIEQIIQEKQLSAHLISV